VTIRDQCVDSIVSLGQSDCNFVEAYPSYFHFQHYPAAFKWYMDFERILPLSFEWDVMFWTSTPDTTNLPNTSAIVIDGSQMVCNTDAFFTIPSHPTITITYGHLCINSSLWLSTGYSSQSAVLVPANTVFGYSALHMLTSGLTGTSGMDFILQDSSECLYSGNPRSVCDGTDNFQMDQFYQNPYYYFTPALQQIIDAGYAAQQDVMNTRGVFPQSTLHHRWDINEAGTLYGTWYYAKSANQVVPTQLQYFPYGFDGGTINILSVDGCDTQSLWRDQLGRMLATNLQGVFIDSQYSYNGHDYFPSNYQKLNMRSMFPVQGTPSVGVIDLMAFDASSTVDHVFMLYELTQSGSSLWDDVLKVQYFWNGVAPLGIQNFTNDLIMYTRFPQGCYGINGGPGQYYNAVCSSAGPLRDLTTGMAMMLLSLFLAVTQ